MEPKHSMYDGRLATVTGEATLSVVPEDFVEKVDLDLAPTHSDVPSVVVSWRK
jgi:hypothetical protein